MNDSMNAIVIENLCCSFRRSEALTDINLSIPTGCVFGLVGLNGAGKTTLIRHLIGGLRPQTGIVRVLGDDPAVVPERVLAKIGYVAEEDALPRWMTVGQLIDFIRSMYANWDDSLCRDLLAQFALHRSTKLSDLSKGGRARTGLLIAIAHRPELLILDEPSYGLDPIARQDILEAVVRTAGEEGRTVLFSSHLLDEVSRVCDTVGVICNGQLIEVVSMQELPQRYSEVIFDVPARSDSTEKSRGLFGYQVRGRECSVIADRDVLGDESEISAAIGGNLIREIRPVSLVRGMAHNRLCRFIWR